MSYDGATGNLTASIADAGMMPHFNARTNFTYDNRGHVQTATDPLGIVTQFGYDSFGNQTSIIRDIGAGRCTASGTRVRTKNGAARPRSNSHQGAESYLILASLNSTCLRATGSYFLRTSFSVMVRAFFLVT